jgi:hypothetical protein
MTFYGRDFMTLTLLLAWLLVPVALAADKVDAMAQQGEARIKEGQQSQRQIDKVQDGGEDGGRAARL